MGCRKGQAKSKPKSGSYLCKKCQATASKEKQLCKPKLVKRNK